MSIIDTLITNRTQADVDALKALYAKPIKTWSTDDWAFFQGEASAFMCLDGPLECSDGVFMVGGQSVRGAYNAADMNRVLDALDYLADRVTMFGYQKPMIKRPCIADANEVRHYYAIGDRPPESELRDYLDNVAAIRAVLQLPAGTPEVPKDISKRILLEEANNIEIILTAVETLMIKLSLHWFYTGEIYSGEV